MVLSSSPIKIGGNSGVPQIWSDTQTNGIFLPCLLKWTEEFVLGGGWVEGVPSIII